MSRSRKKEPGGGLTVADSDKPYKLQEHRRERRQAAAALRRGEEPPVADYGNPYHAPKDGRQFWPEGPQADPKWMRK